MTRQTLQAMAIIIAISATGAKFIIDAEAGQNSPASVLVMSFARTASEYQFEVISNGCTKASDFELEYDNSPQFTFQGDLSELLLNDSAMYMRLVRIKEDQCRRRPMKQLISMAVPQYLQNKPLVLANSFIPYTSLKKRN